MTSADDEFQALQMLGAAPRSYAEAVLNAPSAMSFHNMTKNRYRDIVPREATRVVLSSDGRPGSDYINANHLNVGDGELTQPFICAQAPLPNTMDDFWRMAVEQAVGVIVMLTKVDQTAQAYFPLDTTTPCVFNNFVVSLCEEPKLFGTRRNIVLRKFRLTSSKYASQTVFHLQYLSWPDHGVPETADDLLQLIALTDQCQAYGRTIGLSGPVVAHCSAGVGRTGVFIAVYLVLLRIASGQTASVLATVHAMRQRRHGMVQSAAQYAFIYEAVRTAMARRKESKQLSALLVPAPRAVFVEVNA
jgi:protein tyrosine phosphatase